MGFVKNFIDKKIEQPGSGGWDFSQDNRDAAEFILGGLSLSQDEKAIELLTSTEIPKSADAATLT